MHNHVLTTIDSIRAEHVRRNVRLPEPLDRPRPTLRAIIGHNLIHLGERLARIDRPEFGEAA